MKVEREVELRVRKKTYAVRYTAGQPAEQVFSPELQFPFVHRLPEGALLPDYKNLQVLVWNIFKQQRAEWQSVITDFGKDSHLVMLQEAQTTPELVTFATCHFIAVDQVPALSFPQHPSGVMTLAKSAPIFCCPLREREPLLRLAKSALITVYPMPNGQMLMAVNMHAVNFSLGIDVYRKQLATVGEHIQHHSGPILLAGDFNAWSQPRSKALYHFVHKHHLKEVHFDHDHRRTAFGRPLDFIFYRGMSIEKARVLKAEASDHNPLLAEFSFA